MREIKFRAWDGRERRMVGPFDLEEYAADQDGEGDMGEFPAALEPNPFVEHGILLQFTGLKDKNGVEIYEGDILRHQHRYGTHWQRVEWGTIDGEQEDSIGFVHVDPQCVKDAEVMGNIYENPHLMEDE